ncbi:hypothetical protein A11A3_08145 [Alcanivorax hongdengensis A-11-3]|uniref:Uncharacterized protein n=1 Tax=Alcanivorax hongdengensis A-11-3 TaxID=1177179 RepID=L0WEJ9_9GAMM|nr:hypothetical protein [Alcanivorax hongdengensis]EKF74582.1 hypothetical protein A11A3_08145 [Alcanivorax hongdengensis A-11-3]
MSYRRPLLALALGACLLPATSWAVGPGTGSQSQFNVRIGNCMASSLEVRYRLDSLMGEPIVGGSYRWNGDNRCDLPSSTVIWLKVQSGSTYGYVRLDPAVPGANRGFGYNVSGSPEWDEAICGFNGTRRTGCMNSSAAKSLWKSGRVTGFSVAW